MLIKVIVMDEEGLVHTYQEEGLDNPILVGMGLAFFYDWAPGTRLCVLTKREGDSWEVAYDPTDLYEKVVYPAIMKDMME